MDNSGLVKLVSVLLSNSHTIDKSLGDNCGSGGSLHLKLLGFHFINSIYLRHVLYDSHQWVSSIE